MLVATETAADQRFSYKALMLNISTVIIRAQSKGPFVLAHNIPMTATERDYQSRVRFSKVPKTFRARKAIRNTPTRLFCKAGLFICCKGNKNLNKCKVSCLEKPSF